MGHGVGGWKRWAAAAALAAGALGATGSAPPSGAQTPQEETPTTAPDTTGSTTTTTPTTAPAPSPTMPDTTETTDTTDAAGPPDTSGTTHTTVPDTASTDLGEPAPLDAPEDPAPSGVTVSVEPAEDLVDGTLVTVTATGVPTGTWVRPAQCAAGAQDPYDDCDWSGGVWSPPDASGTASFTLKLDAVFQTGWWDEDVAAEVDCRVAACTVVIVDDYDNVLGEAPLAFAPDGALAPPPVLTVSPGDQLAHNQVVTATATGLVWASDVVLLQCSAAPAHTGDCDYETETYHEIGEETTLTADITLSAVISTDSGTVDCRTPGACTLAVTHDGLRSPEKAALAPLDFDPATEVVPPTLTVEPSTDLVDGQTVTVTASGFTPGWMAFYACAPAPAGEYEECVWLESDVQADSAGTVALDLEVPAIIPTYAGEVDCRTTAQPCQLVGTRFSTSSVRAGRADLHFDPDAPVRPGPAITVDPGDDLPDEATVTVSGSNFSVDAESAPVQVCEVGTDRCDDQTRSRAPIDNDGRFAIELGVAATFEDWSGGTVDCRVAPGCEVVAREGYSGRRATSSLAFAPPGPADDRYLDAVFDEVTVTRDIVYRHATDAAGGTAALTLDIYEPAGDTEAERPVVVWLDGGWFSEGGRADMAAYAEAFARRGYVAVTMAYRARPGLQCCPTDDIEGVTAAIGDATDDAAAGVQWLREHAGDHRIDPDAIAVGGHQGGAAAAAGLTHRAGAGVAAALPVAGVDLGRPAAGEAPFMAFHDTGDNTAPLHLSATACARARSFGTPCGAVGYAADWYDDGGLPAARQRDIVRRSGDFLAEVVLDPLGYVDWTGPTTPGGPGDPTPPTDPSGPGTGSPTTPVAPGSPTAAVGLGKMAATAVATGQVPSPLPRTGADLARLAAVGAGLALLGATALAVRRRRLRPQAISDGGSTRLAAVAALATLALVAATCTAAGAVGPTSPSDDHGEHDENDPGMPHDPGMPDGFDPMWTPEQVAYAQALIDDTAAQLVRYEHQGVLPLIGYVWISDGKRVDEYQHWVHLGRIGDQRTLDPAFPESLVFRTTEDVPALEAAMYMLGLGYNMSNIPPDIDWLPGWHIHDNLCFVGGLQLVGVTVDGECERGYVLPTPPMIHVWVVDTRCGRFAGVDENGLQCDHEH